MAKTKTTNKEPLSIEIIDLIIQLGQKAKQNALDGKILDARQNIGTIANGCGLLLGVKN